MDAAKRLSIRIKELIRQKKTTAEKVAYEAEISKSYLSAILRGIKSPTLRIIQKIARALDVEVKDLF